MWQAAFMPVLGVSCNVVPSRNMEATLFTTLMSVSNAGSVTGGLVGAGLTQFWESLGKVLEIYLC